MRLRWPVVASLAPVGILVGAAIVGPPQGVARDVRIIETPSTTTAPPTTEVIESAGPPPTGPTAATTTAGLQSTTTTAPSEPDEDIVLADIAIVVANATAVSGVAASTADTLASLGFTSTLTTDALPEETTRVYYAPRNETAAGLVAQALGISADAVSPLPDTPLTSIDDRADVVVVVGADRVG